MSRHVGKGGMRRSSITRMICAKPARPRRGKFNRGVSIGTSHHLRPSQHDARCCRASPCRARRARSIQSMSSSRIRHLQTAWTEAASRISHLPPSAPERLFLVECRTRVSERYRHISFEHPSRISADPEAQDHPTEWCENIPQEGSCGSSTIKSCKGCSDDTPPG